MNVEAIGIVASLCVLLSFLMKGEKRIRIINIFGATTFVIYGVIINAFSVWFLNGALLIIHVVRLLCLRKSKGEG